ncbi:PLP-dependent aminotransferase family protein [Corallococcus sp. bb12-1]|uniref:aminotransferase-like domain-containing protein n=1 Tax=Corallococcus sp. bb12-1 TaxID=2996784 RepID=UPI0022703385|nr:PLP-dependent aminotransferase family protein [Corallococcus sp. bb12-1]MCY1041806.1 PLP-dependent aminotransferase family protein [Corallococcus sp. bb12-1]
MLTTDLLHASLGDPLLDVMNFLNEIAIRYPEAISFAPGRPNEKFYDPQQIATYLEAYQRYLREERGFNDARITSLLFQYGRTNGHIGELLARMLEKDEGIRVAPESIVVTVGCQEATFITLRALFSKPTDVLLVGMPCYIGVTGAARLLDIEVAPVPERADGLDLDALEARVRELRAQGKQPRALYLVADFANPSGRSLPEPARHRLLELAAREQFLIIEDNPYGFFSREGSRKPTLKALDDRQQVIYLGSFSKSAFPGLRLGYAVADQRVTDAAGQHQLLADAFSKIKSLLTVNTSALSQAVVGGMLVLNEGGLLEANQEAIRFYKTNMDATLQALERHFPKSEAWARDVTWNVPDGGFFLVMKLPIEADEALLEESARNFHVLWTPMRYFYLGTGGEHELRLSCSYLTPERIEEGVARLARHLQKTILERQPAPQVRAG